METSRSMPARAAMGALEVQAALVPHMEEVEQPVGAATAKMAVVADRRVRLGLARMVCRRSQEASAVTEAVPARGAKSSSRLRTEQLICWAQISVPAVAVVARPAMVAQVVPAPEAADPAMPEPWAVRV